MLDYGPGDVRDLPGMAIRWADSKFTFWNCITLNDVGADSRLLDERLAQAVAYMRQKNQPGLLWLFEDLLEPSARAGLSAAADRAGLSLSLTSNMGLTIISHNRHPYLLRLAAYLTTLNPLVRVLLHQFSHDNGYLIDRCALGLAIEVGPVAQGTLHAELFQQSEALVGGILDFVERCNQGELPKIPETFTLYNQVQILDY